jgi:hypothetical protein
MDNITKLSLQGFQAALKVVDEQFPIAVTDFYTKLHPLCMRCLELPTVIWEYCASFLCHTYAPDVAPPTR